MKLWSKSMRTMHPDFYTLSITTQAYWRHLRTVVDDDGALNIGQGEPWRVLACMLGADQSDRRMLKKSIGELLDRGFAEVYDGSFHMRNTDDFSPPKSNEIATSVERDANEVATTFERGANEVGTRSSRGRHEVMSNPPESFNTGSVEEKRREEKRAEENARASPRSEIPPPPPVPNPFSDSSIRGAFVRGYRDGFEKYFHVQATGVDPVLLDRECAIACVANVAERYDKDPTELAYKCAMAWFDMNHQSWKRPPLWKWFPENVGRMMADYNPEAANAEAA